MSGTCITCLSTENLKFIRELEWKIFDFLLQPFSKKHPEVRNHKMARLCTDCQKSMKFVADFRTRAIYNFQQLMNTWNIRPLCSDENPQKPKLLKVLISPGASTATSKCNQREIEKIVSNKVKIKKVISVLPDTPAKVKTVVPSDQEAPTKVKTEVPSDQEEEQIQTCNRIPDSKIKTEPSYDIEIEIETEGTNLNEKSMNLRKRKNLDSIEDQEHAVVFQNLENVPLEPNQILTQQHKSQSRIYEESHECITPNVILHRNTDIAGDGNCLFNSLICILQLQILTCDLRRQLRNSPYLKSCRNPQKAYKILSSDSEYGDLDCLYLFSKVYNQNICMHWHQNYHYFNTISKNEDTRFCHFKVNDTHNWIHLDLRDLHFTPYFSDDDRRKDDERKRKQRNREYSKRYREKKRTSNLQTGPSTGGVPYVPPVDSNEDQEYVQSNAFENLEYVQLEQKQFLTQQLRLYADSPECITPKVILHRNTDIPGDGNGLFHSLIRILQLKILPRDLRRQLRDSPYLNSCLNPQEAYNILSSDNEYGDLDCLYLFAKIYDQNICVHVISKNEDPCFCHFKANDTQNWIHLDLRDLHFTPYFSDDEKRKEDERKRKQKNKKACMRYRDKKIKKWISDLQTGPSTRDVLDLQPVINTSEIAGPSTGDMPYVVTCGTLDDLKKFICDHCNMKFLAKSYLRSHIKVTHLKYKRPFKCPHCPQMYAFESRLKLHLRQSHDDIPVSKNHICEHCGQAFKTASLLRGHLPVHTDERPFKCGKCDATFGHSASLFLHNTNIHKKKKKKCPQQKNKISSTSAENITDHS